MPDRDPLNCLDSYILIGPENCQRLCGVYTNGVAISYHASTEQVKILYRRAGIFGLGFKLRYTVGKYHVTCFLVIVKCNLIFLCSTSCRILVKCVCIIVGFVLIKILSKYIFIMPVVQPHSGLLTTQNYNSITHLLKL